MCVALVFLLSFLGVSLTGCPRFGSRWGMVGLFGMGRHGLRGWARRESFCTEYAMGCIGELFHSLCVKVDSSLDCKLGVQHLRLFVICQDGNARV